MSMVHENAMVLDDMVLENVVLDDVVLEHVVLENEVLENVGWDKDGQVFQHWHAFSQN